MKLQAGPEETAAVVGIILLIAVAVSVLSSLGVLLVRYFKRTTADRRRRDMLPAIGFGLLIVVAMLVYAFFVEPNLEPE
jgi:uncharacterized membrane-anchored protein